jgi:hypothetical protein
MLALNVIAGPGASAAVTPKLNVAAIQANMKANDGLLTAAKAQQLGLQADTVYINTPQVKAWKTAVDAATAQARASASASPAVTGSLAPAGVNYAAGCNQEVCIEINGSGLTVDSWFTSAYTAVVDECSYPVYWEDDEIAFTGEEICGGADGTLLEATATGFEGEWENGEQLCNTWIDIAGKPCETIEG